MYRNFFKIAFRSLLKNRSSSLINIGGLAVGMAVAMLVGLWIWDELSFDQGQKNYGRIAQVWQFVTFEKDKAAYQVMPIPLAEELRSKYPDFEAVSLSSNTMDVILADGDKKMIGTGNYVEPVFSEMLALNMLAGNRDALKDIHSILLAESLAKTFFGENNPLNKIIKINNRQDVKIAGIYQDFPTNSSFKDVQLLAPWDLLLANDELTARAKDSWDENSKQLFVQLKAGADFEQVSAKIRDIRMKRDNPPSYKPEFFLHPMSKWHLYSSFNQGVNDGGLIRFVWLFGAIGVFVLLLACVNFMNLSTARSERRAKEVGIRKSIGSGRGQLIFQFFQESFLVVVFAFGLSLLLVQLALPFFNDIANKKVEILWFNPWFWAAGLAFIVFTSLVAGSYPALYLSSFRPIKVLKGTFRAGRFAAIPRRVLVVFQYTVSITLIIGTLIVFRQIQFAKNRPVGYSRDGLIEITMKTPDLKQHYDALRNDLFKEGAVDGVSKSFGSITEDYGGVTGVSWEGKKEDHNPLLMSNIITSEYGKTIGWQLVEGRDFSTQFLTDSAAMVVNEAAVALMGFENPVDELVKWAGRSYRVIGVVKDIIKESPFESIKPSFYTLDNGMANVINVKLAAGLSTSAALSKVEKVVKTYNPSAPFEYQFVDAEYARKFEFEVQIGKLAAFLAILAIFISCLGLFGLVSFTAEQRTKEIGIRKVLGASVLNLWGLLSKDFVQLVMIAFVLSIPIAYYYLHDWLQQYTYHIEISWWIFAAAGAGALVITVLTVSYQAIRAALVNPVQSLKSE